MTIEIKVPVLPESVAEATIATWHKKVGDTVCRDENIVDIETDKVVLEVVAPEDGQITEVHKPAGATVMTQEVIARVTPGAATVTVSEPASAPQEEVPPQSPAASPTTRRLAAEKDIDLTTVPGSGKNGRITKQDLMTPTEVTPLSPTPERFEERAPMSRLRARVAERLIQAQQNAAILTTFNEIDMQPVMTCRQNYKDQFEKKYGIKLGFMSFFVTAVVKALQEFPLVNAAIDGQDIIYHGYQDIGIAVSSPRGLVVPILRNAEQMSMADIELAIKEFGVKARDGKLTIADMTGGTFTISNGGTFGSLMSTPILNPPQSGILGMHKIEQRPVAIDGQVVIRPMMYVALSYDHRLIDGAESVRFLVTIKEILEDPTRLVLGI